LIIKPSTDGTAAEDRKHARRICLLLQTAMLKHKIVLDASCDHWDHTCGALGLQINLELQDQDSDLWSDVGAMANTGLVL